MFTIEDNDNISRYDLVHTLAHGVPGVGDVGDAVPGHGAELDHHEHQRQHVLPPPEGGAQRQNEGDDHDDRGHDPGLGEHVGQLLDGAHEEQRADNKQNITIKPSRPDLPSQGGEVPESVENSEDFETTERVESEYERAQDRAEDPETETQAEAFYPRTP